MERHLIKHNTDTELKEQIRAQHVKLSRDFNVLSRETAMLGRLRLTMAQRKALASA